MATRSHWCLRFGAYLTLAIASARVGRTEYQLQYSVPSPTFDASYGISVAADNEFLYLGVPLVSATGYQSGAIVQYERSTGTFVRDIVPPSRSDIGGFGGVTTVDGGRLLTSAPRHPGGNGVFGAGEAYLYDAATGAHLETLQNPVRQHTIFGAAVALTGNDAIVSAIGDDTAGANAGAVYIFDSDDDRPPRRLTTPNNTLGGHNFGRSLAVAGSTLAVTEVVHPDSGAVHLFDIKTGQWLRSIASPHPLSFDEFGASIAVLGDTLLVGAPRANLGTALDVGMIHRFDLDTGDYLRWYASPVPTTGDRFGSSMATLGDNFVVGAIGYDATPQLYQTGRAYLMAAENGAVLQTFNNPDQRAGDAFGRSVAAVGSDVVIAKGGAAYVYRSDGAPFAEPRPPDCVAHVPHLADRRNLILVTHGRNADNDDFGWVREMTDAITEALIRREISSDWDVVPYFWTEEAKSPRYAPDRSRNAAICQGNEAGEILAGRPYERVHLIGHSAGAALVDQIALRLAAADNPPDIHTTFLDAYAPSLHPTYGAHSTWSDNYYNVGDWPSTGVALKNAYNVDVTRLNGCPDTVSGHSWPHEYYYQTIAGTVCDVPGYGFALSVEGGYFDPSSHRHNCGVVLSPNAISEQACSPQAPERHFDWAALPNLEDFNRVVSPTGIVNVLENLLMMQTGSAAWITFDVEVPLLGRALRFTTAFTSSQAAEGLLAIYIDEQAIGTIDERNRPPGASSYAYDLTDIRPGSHTLSFRLDRFTEAASSVEIRDLGFGLLTTTGDANFDGIVDRGDLAILIASFGTVRDATFSIGDFDGDEKIGIRDLIRLRNHFGEVVPTGIAVPEPTTLGLIGIWGIILGVGMFCRSSGVTGQKK